MPSLIKFHLHESYNQACKGCSNQEYGTVHLENKYLAYFQLLKVYQGYLYKIHKVVQIYSAGNWY